jgi:hypothetical protein
MALFIRVYQARKIPSVKILVSIHTGMESAVFSNELIIYGLMAQMEDEKDGGSMSRSMRNLLLDLNRSLASIDSARERKFFSSPRKCDGSLGSAMSSSLVSGCRIMFGRIPFKSSDGPILTSY